MPTALRSDWIASATLSGSGMYGRGPVIAHSSVLKPFASPAAASSSFAFAGS